MKRFLAFANGNSRGGWNDFRGDAEKVYCVACGLVFDVPPSEPIANEVRAHYCKARFDGSDGLHPPDWGSIAVARMVLE